MEHNLTGVNCQTEIKSVWLHILEITRYYFIMNFHHVQYHELLYNTGDIRGAIIDKLKIAGFRLWPYEVCHRPAIEKSTYVFSHMTDMDEQGGLYRCTIMSDDLEDITLIRMILE